VPILPCSKRGHVMSAVMMPLQQPGIESGHIVGNNVFDH